MASEFKQMQSGHKDARSIGRARHSFETIEVEVSPDLAAVLDAVASARNDMSRGEAAAIAIGEWARDRGFIPGPPSHTVPLGKLNSRNDG
jgi:hypothetical protein